jgi:hypothetical protein
MTLITGFRQADERLARLDIPNVIADAVGVAAQELQIRVMEALSQTPGQDHSVPWLRTGALRASIGNEVDGNVGVIGSSSDVAVDQELGTRSVPPRPFLASTAADTVEDIAALIATVVARHLSDS